MTEREKLGLESLQSSYVTGDLVKDEEITELRKHTYPRDFGAYNTAASDKMSRGDYKGGLQDSQQAVQINRSGSIGVGNLCDAYLALNRLDEARTVLDQGLANGIAPDVLAGNYYDLAFLRNDTDTMQKQFALAIGKAGKEDALLSRQSDTEAYHGQLKQAREYSRRAAESAQRSGTKEVAAGWVVNEALREAEFGNSSEARKAAGSAIQLSPRSRYYRGVAALALARAGDKEQAQEIADELAREFPQDTFLNSYWLPMVHASIELKRRHPNRALELLRVAQAYEMGAPTPYIAPLSVIYLRGYSYLETSQNKEAAAEFQRILDHRGIAVNSPIGSLANLGLGRALAASGDTAKARVAYQDFFALWKDADPDIPILKQAKAEYAKLQ